MSKSWEEWYRDVSKGGEAQPVDKDKKDKKEKGSRKQK